MGVRSTKLTGGMCLLTVVAGLLSGCGTVRRWVTEVEWDGLSNEARALYCSGRDGSEGVGGTGVSGAQREVLDDRCPDGEHVPEVDRVPLSASFESDVLDEMRAEFDRGSVDPQDIGLTSGDVEQLCELDDGQVVDTMINVADANGDYHDMPWNGTVYEPSHDFILGAFEIMIVALHDA
jgi:hypothetical protein